MANYPVTHGYTINIVKDRTKTAAVILLNQKAQVPSQTVYLTSPPPDVPDQHRPQTAQHVPEQQTPQADVYLEPLHSVNLESESVAFFTEVAHEEIVEEENDTSVTIPSRCKLSVFCDLCSSKLSSPDEAKLHMKTVHNVLTYEGPFFKCDFCGLLVTDRVTHMKQAHYSPLSGAFTKSSSGYQCRECQYVSDQLTNIRNHVDAKHSNVVGENKYVCEECKSVYKTLNSMRAHRSRVHGKKRRQETGQVKRESKVLKKVDSNRKEKLEKEILELELKTLPSIVSRGNEANKYYLP